MKLTFPSQLDKDQADRFETYLKRHVFPFKKKKTGGVQHYTVEINEPLDAFWIGCNIVALTEGIFDGPLTTTLA